MLTSNERSENVQNEAGDRFERLRSSCKTCAEALLESRLAPTQPGDCHGAVL